MPDKLAVDANFVETVISAWPLAVSAVAGAYAMYKLIRHNVRKDVHEVRKEVEDVAEKIVKIQDDIEECEGDHVYKDEFERVCSLVEALHAHILGGTAHDKRSTDTD